MQYRSESQTGVRVFTSVQCMSPSILLPPPLKGKNGSNLRETMGNFLFNSSAVFSLFLVMIGS